MWWAEVQSTKFCNCKLTVKNSLGHTASDIVALNLERMVIEDDDGGGIGVSPPDPVYKLVDQFYNYPYLPEDIE